MLETKVCSCCGETKPVDQFRRYYAGRKGHYRYCKACERVETRRKYLCKLGDKMNDAQRRELDAINELYALRAERGLQRPGGSRDGETTVKQWVDEQLQKVKT